MHAARIVCWIELTGVCHGHCTKHCGSPAWAASGAQALYDACPGWGWSDAKKRAELADPAARYLVVFEQPQSQQAQQQSDAPAAATAAAAPPAAAEVAGAAPLTATAGAAALEAPAAASAADEQRENSAAAGNTSGTLAVPGSGSSADGCLPGRPLAFVHFRFEVEESEAVLYCYEIQVATAGQVRDSLHSVRAGWSVQCARPPINCFTARCEAQAAAAGPGAAACCCVAALQLQGKGLQGPGPPRHAAAELAGGLWL